jgi:hypothetical protein
MALAAQYTGGAVVLGEVMRRSHLIVAGFLIAVLAVSVGGALLIMPMVDSIRSQPAPVEALLTLDDLPPGFATVAQDTWNLGFETVATRQFQRPRGSFVRGPFYVESSAIRLRIGMNEAVETAMDSFLATASAADPRHSAPVRIDGPALGAPAAWRIQQGLDSAQPTDWLAVGVQHGNTFAIVRVLGERSDVSIDTVAPLGLLVAQRLGARGQ